MNESTKQHRLERLCYLKAHDVVTAIDKDRFTGDAGARFRKQKRSGCADFRGIDIALEGGALHTGLEHVSELRNSSRRQRLYRASRKGVHADGVRPKAVRQIPHGGIERRLGPTSDIVVRN